jgi:hypothetical protein
MMRESWRQQNSPLSELFAFAPLYDVTAATGEGEIVHGNGSAAFVLAAVVEDGDDDKAARSGSSAPAGRSAWEEIRRPRSAAQAQPGGSRSSWGDGAGVP